MTLGLWFRELFNKFNYGVAQIILAVYSDITSLVSFYIKFIEIYKQGNFIW